MRILTGSLKLQHYMRRIIVGAVCLGSFVASTAAWAQSCPLCYRAAATSKSGAVAALRSGILILMIPPVIIFGLVTLMAVRGRDRFIDSEEAAASGTEQEPEPVEALADEDHVWS